MCNSYTSKAISSRDNGIDESTLSFLIDVHNKRPEALAKLLQDSGLETYELDEDMANNYTPNHYSVSDNSLALDDVINDLSQNDEGNQVLSIVSSVWDEESRRCVDGYTADDGDFISGYNYFYLN